MYLYQVINGTRTLTVTPEWNIAFDQLKMEKELGSIEIWKDYLKYGSIFCSMEGKFVISVGQECKAYDSIEELFENELKAS